jgi:hypothetical protein
VQIVRKYRWGPRYEKPDKRWGRMQYESQSAFPAPHKGAPYEWAFPVPHKGRPTNGSSRRLNTPQRVPAVIAGIGLRFGSWIVDRL